MKRNIERFERAAQGVEAGKIGGAVGTFANISPEVKHMCAKTWNSSSRNLYTDLIS